MEFEERELERSTFIRRALVLIGFFLILIFVFLARTFSLQISQFSQFDEASISNRTYKVPVQPLRGKILDRNGISLMRNIATYDLITLPNNIKDIDEFLDSVGDLIELSSQEKTEFKEKFESKAFFNKELVLKRDLSQHEISKFEVRQFRFPSSFVEKRYQRFSDQNTAFAHVLGHTGNLIDEYALTETGFTSQSWSDGIFSYSSGLIEGKSGLEKTYDKTLKGKFGFKVYEVDARGRLLNEINFQPPINGSDLYTTLDYYAQLEAERLMNQRRGAVVAVDLLDGGIVTLYSSPSYSINRLSNGISNNEYNQLENDDNKPFFNRAVSGRYPPASTIKPAMAMFGISQDIVDWPTLINDPGYFVLPEDGRIYRGWKEDGHGNINLQEAITKSSNTYFFNVAYMSDINKLGQHLRLLGFGRKVCIDCFEEVQGLVPGPQWKLNNFLSGWSKGDTVNLGVGQGYAITTPLQLANYASIVANEGSEVKMHLNRDLGKQDIIAESIFNNFKSLDWELLHGAMEGVIESNQGTARRLKDMKTFRVAAKTGTGELLGLETREEYEIVRKDERLRDHAVIIAFGPMPNPRYAISVIVENGESGGAVAGPIAIGVLKTLIKQSE